MNRYHVHRGLDKRIFRRTALRTRAVNVYGYPARGGIRF